LVSRRACEQKANSDFATSINSDTGGEFGGSALTAAELLASRSKTPTEVGQLSRFPGEQIAKSEFATRSTARGARTIMARK